MTSRRATSPSPSASSLRSDTWNSTESERKSGSYLAREGLTTLLPVGWALWQQPSGPARWDLMRHTTDLALAIRRYIAVAESAEPIQDAKDSLSACINATVTALQVCDQETGRGQTGEETPAKCAQKYLRIAQCKLEGNALSKSQERTLRPWRMTKHALAVGSSLATAAAATRVARWLGVPGTLSFAGHEAYSFLTGRKGLIHTLATEGRGLVEDTRDAVNDWLSGPSKPPERTSTEKPGLLSRIRESASGIRSRSFQALQKLSSSLPSVDHAVPTTSGVK